MPTFDTPEPISAVIEFDVGSLRIAATQRVDTVVEVLPSDESEELDMRAARQTVVTCEDGRLRIKGPRKRSLFGRPGSLAVTVQLPADSEVQVGAQVANIACQGRLGDCRLTTAVGAIELDEAANVRLKTDHGDIRVDRATGDAEISGSGRISVGDIAGTAKIKNLNGETVVGEVSGDLRANSSNGNISIDVACADVTAKSAHGSIRIGRAARGQVVIETAAGDLEVGIPAGTAAWLDVSTSLGAVRNSLDPAEGPAEGLDAADTVEVRGRSGLGDIVIRRS